MIEPLMFNFERWTPRRKARVIYQINNEQMTFAEACTTYHLSCDELDSWFKKMQSHGLAGLRVSRKPKPKSVAHGIY